MKDIVPCFELFSQGAQCMLKLSPRKTPGLCLTRTPRPPPNNSNSVIQAPTSDFVGSAVFLPGQL